MILLDTHALIWLDSGSRRLGPETRKLLDTAYQREELAVSAISFWETAMLVERGRIEIATPPLTWRQDLLAEGLVEIAVSGDIGVTAATLEAFHGDPADRVITATAILREAQLVTADDKILNWSGNVSRLDARK